MLNSFFLLISKSLIIIIHLVIPHFSHLFSAWGEGTFLAIQTAIIAALVLHYGGATGKAASFLAVYSAIVAALISGQTPTDVLWTMQASNVPIILFAKVRINNVIIYLHIT